MERDRYGGYGGFGGLGKTDYTPYEVPLHASEVSLTFAGNRWSNSDEIDVAVLDAPRRLPIESIYFDPEFSIEEYVNLSFLLYAVDLVIFSLILPSSSFLSRVAVISSCSPLDRTSWPVFSP